MGKLTFRVFDVEGLRSAREKWIHLFDTLNVVIFLAAISAYDTCIDEDLNVVSLSILSPARPSPRVLTGTPANVSGLPAIISEPIPGANALRLVGVTYAPQGVGCAGNTLEITS
jgi:hypothetical protein